MQGVQPQSVHVYPAMFCVFRVPQPFVPHVDQLPWHGVIEHVFPQSYMKHWPLFPAHDQHFPNVSTQGRLPQLLHENEGLFTQGEVPMLSVPQEATTELTSSKIDIAMIVVVGVV